MKKLAVTALLFSFAQNSLSAEAIITGQGQVFSAPDTIELIIQVESKCYPTAADARKENDQATRNIVDFLNTKINTSNNYNRVIASGGFTAPYQTYYQDKIYCQNSFQKQSTITFRTQNVKHYEALFNEIQNMVYKQFSKGAPSVIQQSISFVTMSDPMPSISPILRSELERNAISLAFKDAQTKLAALFDTTKIQNLKMTHASEIPPDEPKPLYQSRTAGMMSARMDKEAQASAPVQWDHQTIEKVMYFTFTFDDIPLSGR